MDLKTYAVLEKLKSNSALLDHMVKHKAISIDQASDFFKPLLEKEENKEIKLLVDDYPKYLATHVKLHIEQLSNNELQVNGEINDQLLNTISLLSGDDNQQIVENAIKSNLTAFSDQDVKLDNLEMSDSNQNALNNQLPPLTMTTVEKADDQKQTEDQKQAENQKQADDQKQADGQKQDDDQKQAKDQNYDQKQADDKKQVEQPKQADDLGQATESIDASVPENYSDVDDQLPNEPSDVDIDVDDQLSNEPSDVDIDGAIAAGQGANVEPAESENKSDDSVNTEADASTKDNKSVENPTGQNDTEKPAKKTESNASKPKADTETQQLAYDRKVAQTLREAMHFLLSEIKKYKLDEELPNINTKALMI